jgi:MFS family permease
MAASTLLFFFGTSFSVLVVARALQGSAAAFVWTAGPTYINGRVGPEKMGTAMAWITMGSSFGEVTGPVAGGLLYENSGHFALLDVAVGIVLLDIVLRLIMEEEESETPVSSACVSNERTPFIPQDPPAYKPEISPNRSILIILLSNGDLLASLWVGFMTAVIRTALEMVRYAQLLNVALTIDTIVSDDPDFTPDDVQLVRKL